MLGAILGDIVGSPYEFDHNNYKHKDFPLLSEKSHFTDDTVMTAAVAVGLIDGRGLPERTFCAVQHEMRFWGREYPQCRLRRDVPPVAARRKSEALWQFRQRLGYAGVSSGLAVRYAGQNAGNGKSDR